MYNSDFFFKGVNVGGGGELRSRRGEGRVEIELG